jgi:hypothetical protein
MCDSNLPRGFAAAWPLYLGMSSALRPFIGSFDAVASHVATAISVGSFPL